MLDTIRTINETSINFLRKQITEEGAFRLAAAILESAYKDYVRALNKVKTLWEQKCKNNKLEKEWKNAIAIKNREENFYYSRLFEILTLGKSMPGRDVVRKIQKMNKYFSTIYER